MTPLAGLPILTVAETRAAEAATGASAAILIERAGAGVAEWTARLASGAPVLVLCGPGHNGDDGYVAARALQAGGVRVSVAAFDASGSGAAQAARAGWLGPVVSLAQATSAPIVIDALFGTGARSVAAEVAEQLSFLVSTARLSLAVDLPSGLDADTARSGGSVVRVDITLALGALKPAHLLQPGAGLCGKVRLVDIGLKSAAAARVLARPSLPEPSAASHKYTRGLVMVMAGAMPGAARLAALATLRAGAGYTTLLDGDGSGPAAIVQRPFSAGSLGDGRVGAVVIGPGLGRDGAARERLAQAMATDRPIVIDGDALHLITLREIAARHAATVLTPHAGEFAALFGEGGGSKLDRTRDAAAHSGAVVIHKGSDTVIATPDGQAILAPSGSPWLSTAGTGDVLAGVVGAMLASGLASLAAAEAAVWLHARAARDLGPAFIADDLAGEITHARAAA